MADPSTCPPLTPSSIRSAHAKIAKYIHRTPLITCATLDRIASSPDPRAFLSDDPPPTSDSDHTNGSTAHAPNGSANASPQFNLFFKCENLQKIGAFKARGAHHAIIRLIDEIGIDKLKEKGVVTHSSGNHAQALALAAKTFDVPSYIVMPGISTPSKISGTRVYTRNVVFSGSTSEERERKVEEVMRERGCVLVPPYDHPDIILGQGTVGLEVEEQFAAMQEGRASWKCSEAIRDSEGHQSGEQGSGKLDAVIAPIGGGGLLAGIATYFSDKPTRVLGAEPSFEGADDARRGVEVGKRIESVKTLTIADGLRTPVGINNWKVVSDRSKVEGFFSVTEEEIKMAMRLVFERMKLVIEPSGCVPLAVVLFNQDFREYAARLQNEEGKDGWDVGVVFSGGNTTMKAIAGLFGEKEEGKKEEREEGKVGKDGERKAENVAG